MSRDIARPAEPTRAEMLETVNDRGLRYYRNPTHLRAVEKDWPWPQTAEAKNEHRIMKMEMYPSARNGSLPK